MFSEVRQQVCEKKMNILSMVIDIKTKLVSKRVKFAIKFKTLNLIGSCLFCDEMLYDNEPQNMQEPMRFIDIKISP